jgi:hypothetical protein
VKHDEYESREAKRGDERVKHCKFSSQNVAPLFYEIAAYFLKAA